MKEEAEVFDTNGELLTDPNTTKKPSVDGTKPQEAANKKAGKNESPRIQPQRKGKAATANGHKVPSGAKFDPAALLKGRRRIIAIIAAAILLVAILISRFLPSGGRISYREYVFSNAVSTLNDNGEQGIGKIEISTQRVPLGIVPTYACYTPGGRILLVYRKGSQYVLCTMAEDTSSQRTIYQGKLSDPTHLCIFADNQRILTSEGILECTGGSTIDNCPELSMQLKKLTYPDNLVKDSQVTDPLASFALSPDNEHIAWTMQRKDIGPWTALAELVKEGDSYKLKTVQVISQTNRYSTSPDDESLLMANPLRGRAVSQFANGGTGLCMSGIATNGMPEAVIQDIQTGELSYITNHPGYDGAAYLAPNEVYGLVMSTRFSATTNLAALGWVPRPYGDPVQSIMDIIERYSIKGVRKTQKGTLGPVLLNVWLSSRHIQYEGMNLSTSQNWIYTGDPMSWNHDGTKAMWMEVKRNENAVRIQVLRFLEPIIEREAYGVEKTPVAGDYANERILTPKTNGTIKGRANGLMTISTKESLLEGTNVTVSYENFSNDGVYFYNGLEVTKTTGSDCIYTSSISVSDTKGEALGSQDVRLEFSSKDSPTVNTSPNRTYGSATWDSVTREVNQLAN